LLNRHQVQYLIVGGYAVMKYTEPFYTKDLDIWVEPVAENAKRALAALVEFGAPMADLTVHDLTQSNIVFQLGMPPVRVEISATSTVLLSTIIRTPNNFSRHTYYVGRTH
jgi:hypothetical protein